MNLRVTPLHLFVSLLGFTLACGDGSASSGGDGGASSSGPGATGPGATGPGATTSTGRGDTGAGSTLGSCQIFPADNPWNQDVSGLDVHPDSDAFKLAETVRSEWCIRIDGNVKKRTDEFRADTGVGGRPGPGVAPAVAGPALARF